ncbi:hypothetical protein PSACC_00204 [Paramicrosporidium saccamoebae]|uniref:Uncharacterized protein n=1 Tax=Paramicrosporidium saccamoebae TaxID=1246581 RepID=A0A2H9TQD6_9FUNG|nr:hypothetical protein PSACC_00204 [Paramicrosporidium saccamoebae]
MDTVITVFALACTTVAGMRTCYLGLLAENLNGWLTVGEMFAHSVVLFGGTIVAAGAASWSYGIAVDRFHEVDTSLIPQLPLQVLERVYDTYLTKQPYLSLQDFKKECLSTVTCFEAYDFGKMAALLLFVEPIEASRCEEWFVECGTILRIFRTAKGKELADIIKYLWKKKTLVRSLQLDCTLNAMRRLDDEEKQALCLALYEAYPWDPWIEAYLPRPPGVEAVTSETRPKPLPDIPIERWYPTDSFAQCRLCKFRPAETVLLWFFLEVSRSMLRRAKCCTFCGYRTLKLRLISSPEPAENPDRELRNFGILNNNCL